MDFPIQSYRLWGAKAGGISPPKKTLPCSNPTVLARKGLSTLFKVVSLEDGITWIRNRAFQAHLDSIPISRAKTTAQGTLCTAQANLQSPNCREIGKLFVMQSTVQGKLLTWAWGNMRPRQGKTEIKSQIFVPDEEVSGPRLAASGGREIKLDLVTRVSS